MPERGEPPHPVAAPDATVTRPGARTAICLSTLGLAAVAPSPAAIEEPVRFDADELTRIVRQGSWPPPVQRDPTNRVSGNAAAIAFGRQLFFEPRFSPSGYIACVACHYRAAFGADPARQNAETVLVNVGKALAAYQETLATGRTAFDDFRDALARGEPAPRSYPPAAQRGLKLFVGRGNCFACHSGPNFTDGAFRATGVPPFVGQAAADDGLYAGLRTLRASQFNLQGRYSDDTARSTANAARDAPRDLRDRGKWRTPSLRNVGVAAPYLHNGVASSLYDVVRRYARSGEKRRPGDDERDRRRVDLSAGDVEDLVAFLHTLTDADGARRPLAPLEAAPCD